MRYPLSVGIWIVSMCIGLHLMNEAMAQSERRWPLCQVESVYASSRRIRMLAKLTTVGGEKVLEGRSLRLRDGTRTIACLPPSCQMQTQRFAQQSEQAMDVALLWETSHAVVTAHPEVQAALQRFVGKLPTHSRVLVLPVHGIQPMEPVVQSVPDAGAALQRVPPSEDIDIRLVDNLRVVSRALTTRRTGSTGKLPPRQVVVVVGSGLDSKMVPSRFAQLGDEFFREQVPIYSIALSPQNYQLPMLNLAELSWRSVGTFRWAKVSQEVSLGRALDQQLESLLAELLATSVVMFSGSAIQEFIATLPSHAQLGADCGESSSVPRSVIRLAEPTRRHPYRRQVSAVVISVTLAVVALLFWRRLRIRKDGSWEKDGG